MPRRSETTSTEILNFIVRYGREHGYPPTRREIAAEFGVVPSTAQRFLERLDEEGLATNVPAIPRSIRITDAGMKAVTEVL